jgi:hypothetical protein
MSNNNRTHLVTGLTGVASKNGVEMMRNGGKDQEPAVLRFGWAIFGLLLIAISFVGNEAIKVVFRNNFGKKDVKFPGLIPCFLCFIGFSIFAFTVMNSADGFIKQVGSPASYFVTGILYIVLAFYVLQRGYILRKKNQNNDHSNPKGDSVLLGFLLKDLSQGKVQNLAEPLVVLTAGLAFCLFNLLAGLPLILCALSVWLELLRVWIFGKNDLHQNVIQINSQANKQNGFYEIDADL